MAVYSRLPVVEPEVKERVQQLFYEKYQHENSRNCPITKSSFLEAGWTPETYLDYYSYLHEVYVLCLAHELMGEHCSIIANRERFLEYFRNPPYKSIDVYLAARLNRLTGLTISLTQMIGTQLLGFGCELWTREVQTVVDYAKGRAYYLGGHPIGVPMPFEKFVSNLENDFGRTIKEQREGTYTEYKKVTYMPPEAWAEEENKNPYYFDADQMTYEQAMAKKDEIVSRYNEIEESILALPGYSSEQEIKYLWSRHEEAEILDFQMRLLEGRLDEFENGDFNLEGDTLLIYKGDNKCFREKHEIIPTTARVVARRGHRVDINVNYCYDCHKYFISEPEFFHYRDLYGIGCKLAIDRESSGYAHFPMAEYSILRLYGYNVGKNDDLSDEERKQILKMLIDHNFVSKPLIIKYLNQFIKMNGSRDNMEDCVSKWTEDLEYVRNLGMDTQDRVDIDEIKYAHS